MITAENYFSKENNMKYMSASQFKAFMNCEASALAEIKGEYARQTTTALLVGSYVDAHFEGTLDIFKAKNSEIFTKQGTLKSEYKQAEYIINRIERDSEFVKMMSGAKQVIKTGKIEGVPFKIKMDSYHKGIRIVDLKIMRDFSPIWKDGEKLNFVEAWGYDFQGAIYQAIEGNDLPFVIAGATKENEPDIELISVPQGRLYECLEIVKENVNRFAMIKKGKIIPARCGRCDYCKSTKILTNVIDYREVG